MYRRKFRADVYNEVNEPSKQALIKYLKSEGHEIVSTEEDYNADVVSVKDGKTYYHEVERKAQWGEDYLGNRGFTLLSDSRWPSEWEEVRIPGRKQRLIKKYQDEIDNLFFYVLNCEYTKAWKIKGSQMTDDVIRKPSFARVDRRETFYHIPYTEAELIIIDKESHDRQT